jgi:hypothetical protein
MASAALALVIANSPLADTYFAALKAYLGPLSRVSGAGGPTSARPAGPTDGPRTLRGLSHRSRAAGGRAGRTRSLTEE